MILNLLNGLYNFSIFSKKSYDSPTVVDIESDIGLITCSSGTTGPSKCKLNSILLL